MLVSRLQRALVGRRISITEQDVRRLLNSPYYKQLFSDEYRVGHIMITTDENASEEVVRALEKANNIVTNLREGAEFGPVAMAEVLGQLCVGRWRYGLAQGWRIAQLIC